MFDINLFFDMFIKLLPGLKITLLATVIGMLIASVVGLIWAVTRLWGPTLIKYPVIELVRFIRNTPLLIQLYFAYFVLPEIGFSFSPLITGIIVLALHYSSYTAEVYRAGIESIHHTQWEAARALNLTNRQSLRLVILPQAIPPMIPALGNYLIAMFKDTPMLSVITLHELLQSAMTMGAEDFRYLEPVTAVGVYFLVLSLISSRSVTYLDKRMNRA